MEISRYLIKAAEDHLKADGAMKLPAQLAGTDFYLASKEDDTVIAHGVIAHKGIEYKIGIKL